MLRPLPKAGLQTPAGAWRPELAAAQVGYSGKGAHEESVGSPHPDHGASRWGGGGRCSDPFITCLRLGTINIQS